MMSRVSAIGMAIVLAAGVGCGKKKSKGNVTPQLMKASTAASLRLAGDAQELLDSGTPSSAAQSFTPTSVKIPIFSVSLCQDTSKCHSVYTCSAGTVDGCSVELANVQAFVDQLNASSQAVDTGTYNWIGISYVAGGDTSQIQHISVTGSVSINGVSYATDPTAGLVAGGTPKAAAFDIKGGGGTLYPISPALVVTKGGDVKVKILFDPSNYALGGNGAANSLTAMTYQGSGNCVGSQSSLFVCGQVTTLIGAVADGAVTVEHYLLTWDEDGEYKPMTGAAPTGGVVLYFDAAGQPLGGVQTLYFTSGSGVTWGRQMGGGISLQPATVDSGTVSFGTGGGADPDRSPIFGAFKRADHSGTFSIGGVKHAYSAKKI